MPSISVAICTRNRAELLKRTLCALKGQTIGVDNFELLIVDNASTDNTYQVFKSFLSLFPHFRYVFEPTLGIANARNCAAREASCQYLVYIDDDAVPVENWLEIIVRPFQEITPTPVCVVGKVDLEWEGSRPEWIPLKFDSLYASFDFGLMPRPLVKGEYLLTTNAAFDCQLLLAIGSFRPELGHRGKNLLGGEDNDIFNRLVLNGHVIWYEPRALVTHWTPRERQTRKWLYRRVFWDGATKPLLDYGLNKSRYFYIRQLLYDFRCLIHLVLDVLLGQTDAYYLLLQRAGRLRTNLLLAMRRM